MSLLDILTEKVQEKHLAIEIIKMKEQLEYYDEIKNIDNKITKIKDDIDFLNTLDDSDSKYISNVYKNNRCCKNNIEDILLDNLRLSLFQKMKIMKKNSTISNFEKEKEKEKEIIETNNRNILYNGSSMWFY